MLDKLRNITAETISEKNLPPSTYYPFSNKDASIHSDYNLRAIIGLLVSYITEKKMPKEFSFLSFKESCLSAFENDLTDPSAASVLESVFFPNNSMPTFSLLLFQAHLPDNKSSKVFDVFKLMMKQDDYAISFDTKLNFLESRIVKQFEQILIDNKHNDQTVSYLPFLDELFTKDIAFLAKNTHYFTQYAEQFLRLYLFLYCSQLALNLNPHTFEMPFSRPLYFILNYEKASTERKKLVYEGYRTLYEHAKYIFPYLSFLETLMKITENENLRLYELPTLLEDTQETVDILQEFESKFRSVRKLEGNVLEHTRTNEALKSLLNAVMEQFRDQSSRKDIFENYRRAFERQVAEPFIQGRGRFGKVLVLGQDTVLLLTNIAIAEQKQMRFQDLMVQFENRGVYFDQQSRLALIELYERVGNIDRKSDSGDAVYVKTTL
jgi:DNA phosphorothioation-dependent restriction protein DptG